MSLPCAEARQLRYHGMSAMTTRIAMSTTSTKKKPKSTAKTPITTKTTLNTTTTKKTQKSRTM